MPSFPLTYFLLARHVWRMTLRAAFGGAVHVGGNRCEHISAAGLVLASQLAIHRLEGSTGEYPIGNIYI